jgi:diamine N-acetyltransferase
MDQMIIKQAGIDDVMLLQDIAQVTFGETFAQNNTAANLRQYIEEKFNVDRLKTELGDPDSYFFLALDFSSPVGYIKLNTGTAQTEPQPATFMEIERIYVLNAYQGKKIGQLLFSKAVEFATRQGRDYLWLGVWEKNLKAIQFYEKNGFVPFDQHIFKLGNDEQTDVMMKKQIR